MRATRQRSSGSIRSRTRRAQSGSRSGRADRRERTATSFRVCRASTSPRSTARRSRRLLERPARERSGSQPAHSSSRWCAAGRSPKSATAAAAKRALSFALEASPDHPDRARRLRRPLSLPKKDWERRRASSHIRLVRLVPDTHAAGVDLLASRAALRRAPAQPRASRARLPRGVAARAGGRGQQRRELVDVYRRTGDAPKRSRAAASLAVHVDELLLCCHVPRHAPQHLAVGELGFARVGQVLVVELPETRVDRRLLRGVGDEPHSADESLLGAAQSSSARERSGEGGERVGVIGASPRARRTQGPLRRGGVADFGERLPRTTSSSMRWLGS